MQFTAHRDALLTALAPGVALAFKDSSTPALGYVLIEVDKHGTISATGTNLLATMTRTVQGAETRTGSVCAPGQDLNKILRLMPAGDVRLSAAVNSDITLESLVPRKKVRVQLRGLHAVDFPKLDRIDLAEHKPTVMRVADLRAVSDAVLYAASKDAHRPHLGVMHIEREAGGPLHAVTTDGHRLCHASARVPFGKRMPTPRSASSGAPAGGEAVIAAMVARRRARATDGPVRPAPDRYAPGSRTRDCRARKYRVAASVRLRTPSRCSSSRTCAFVVFRLIR